MPSRSEASEHFKSAAADPTKHRVSCFITRRHFVLQEKIVMVII
ncbi:MAG: hypothetical protein ACH346_00220 [Chthoniobacterales bacterium]